MPCCLAVFAPSIFKPTLVQEPSRYPQLLMADHDFPNFTIVAENIETISREQVILATHVGRIPNLPALDFERQILQAIGDLSQRIDDGFAEVVQLFDDIDRRFNAVDQRLNKIEQYLEEDVEQRFKEADHRFDKIERLFDAVTLRLNSSDFNRVARPHNTVKT
ncbi:hypothetical protein C7212DRAFT_361478 [Tuber magnatum]|uniref:Uncharacterized protein n=1 Tax=Tuber magnatum TaxID=42249 RepID=A0A317SZZ5_9PEZI|nr:hypothetical protein C7212DRAFT_361478 [Tuber magnatum]